MGEAVGDAEGVAGSEVVGVGVTASVGWAVEASAVVVGSAAGTGVAVSLLVPQATAISAARPRQAMILRVFGTNSKLQPNDS